MQGQGGVRVVQGRLRMDGRNVQTGDRQHENHHIAALTMRRRRTQTF